MQTRQTADDVFLNAKFVQNNIVKGPHPAGNVGTQIHEIDPLNKGEVIWYINPQDVLILGRYSLTGFYDVSKVISLGGEGSSEKNILKLF